MICVLRLGLAGRRLDSVVERKKIGFLLERGMSRVRKCGWAHGYCIYCMRIRSRIEFKTQIMIFTSFPTSIISFQICIIYL